ncbi:hypothetical protein ACQPYH_04150 [Kribbella sp. CA-245084]|uniref:hypothetical protein n=1 Tax=Kribbella sp. CA-245084 TaxID=3239940 RepID=UPI003D8F8870
MASLIAAADEHAPLVGCFGRLVAGQVGVGVCLGGTDDPVQPVRRNAVDQRCGAFVDGAGGLFGQFQAGRGEAAGFPRGGITGQDAGPGEREPVLQRERFTKEAGGHCRGDAEHQSEFGDRELRDLRAAVTAEHHRALASIGGPATGPEATDRRVEAVGVDLGMLQQPRVGLIGHRAVLGGRLEQVGRRQRLQIRVEHVFDSICSRSARQIGRAAEPLIYKPNGRATAIAVRACGRDRRSRRRPPFQCRSARPGAGGHGAPQLRFLRHGGQGLFLTRFAAQ